MSAILTGGPLFNVAASPDGADLYSVGSSGGGRLWTVHRDPATGAISPNQFFTPSDVPLMQTANDVVVTPDNKAVIIGAGECCNFTVLNFDRVTEGPTRGNVEVPSTLSDCVTGNFAANCQQRMRHVESERALAQERWHQPLRRGPGRAGDHRPGPGHERPDAPTW